VTVLLPEYVSRRASSHPSDIAVVMDARTLTYSELDSSSNRLAHWLRDVGCGQGDRVCLLTGKSPDAVIGIIGILKAGSAYVPLDVDAPVARIEMVVESADPSAIIADGASIPLLAEILSTGVVRESIPVAWIDAGTDVDGTTGVGSGWTTSSPSEVTPLGGPEDMAYIMFTSGSTGTPKGVVINHSNVVAFVEWAVRHFGIDGSDRNSGHPPLFFDLSVFDLFGTFAAGAQLHLVPPERNIAPRDLLDLIGSSQLTQWFSVPSVLTYLARYANLRDADLSSLRRVLWCGDVLPTTTLLRWMDRLPHAEFTNLYGPTETTIASSWYAIPERPSSENEKIPIGVPCDGEELLVLDDNLQPVSEGTIGDLHIAGVGLSSGYWRDGPKTAEAFQQLPMASSDLSDRIYHTGDLASVREGLFYFHGRVDSQIKSRGYRIELAEIELALSALGLVSDCAVVGAVTDGFEGTAICCAYVPSHDPDGAGIPPRRLRSALRESLPSYMLPSRWKAMDALPTTGNGKIDRRSLREMFESGSA
jgi:amino acid adenylation domain-containing protein